MLLAHPMMFRVGAQGACPNGRAKQPTISGSQVRELVFAAPAGASQSPSIWAAWTPDRAEWAVCNGTPGLRHWAASGPQWACSEQRRRRQARLGLGAKCRVVKLSKATMMLHFCPLVLCFVCGAVVRPGSWPQSVSLSMAAQYLVRGGRCGAEATCWTLLWKVGQLQMLRCLEPHGKLAANPTCREPMSAFALRSAAPV